MNNIKPKKSLGQNFLTNISVAADMARHLEINENDNVLEIGGGQGAVTAFLIKYPYKALDVYELDKSLVPVLKREFKENNINVINENFLDADLTHYNGDFKVVGSIPYYITSPIIHTLLELPIDKRPHKIVLMMQKEVGEKILSQVPASSYWSYITLGYKVELVRFVSEKDFYPEPMVKSIVIKMTRDEEGAKQLEKIGFRNWSKFLHHVYRNPRKMINKVFEKEFLDEVEVASTLRPQNIELDKWIEIFEKTH
jgi:16S rRNA (adenine1518-N6/adenine1519-N6)-dimethyltransferase